MSKTKPKSQSQPVLPPSAPLPVVAVAPIKRYDENFRKNAVEHWIKTGRPGTQIAAELGVSSPSLKEWKRRYHGDAMPEHGNLELENRTLRAELARVREQRDILKKTLGIFTEPSQPVTKSSKP
jgi:transposase